MSAKTFDRSAYQATKVNTLKSQDEEIKELTGYSNDGRVGFLKLKEGKNKLRIYPGHPDTSSFCYARTVHFLELEKTDKDGNAVKNDNGQVQFGRRPVFNAKVHGEFPKGTVPVDIIDEYVQRVYKKAHAEIQDDEQRKKYLSTMTYWKTGITGKTKWIVYGALYNDQGVPEFGRVELPTTVKDKLNEISANQDGDGILEVDPFTDPDEGRIVFITYDPKEKDAKKKYSASIDFKKPTALTDDELQKHFELDSLESLLKKSYKHKDFMNALDGLKRFDSQSENALRALGFDSGYQIFADDDFLDICEKVGEYFPKEFKDAASSNSFVDESTQESAPFKAQAAVTLEEMNLDQLAQYVHKNGLDITILPDDSEVDIVQAIRDEEGNATGEVVEEKPVEEVTPRRQRGARTSNLD